MIDETPYTPGMREVMKLAKAEAGRLGHDYIGPEHYLLGIIRKGDGIAFQMLQDLDVDPGKLKEEIERLLTLMSARAPGNFKPTPETKDVLECAKKNAMQFRHARVGTHHLMLGLLMVHQGVTANALRHFGVEFETVNQAIAALMENYRKTQCLLDPPPDPVAALPLDEALIRSLNIANGIARKMDHDQVRPEHLLLALLKDPEGAAARYLSQFGVDYVRAKSDLF